jgi:hypothetical protein
MEQEECQPKEHQLFGEEFAWVAITAIVTYTYAIINVVTLVA